MWVHDPHDRLTGSPRLTRPTPAMELRKLMVNVVVTLLKFACAAVSTASRCRPWQLNLHGSDKLQRAFVHTSHTDTPQHTPSARQPVSFVRTANRFRGSTTQRVHKMVLHECDLCGYQTQVRTSMVVHMRIHTGEKPFAVSKRGAAKLTLTHSPLRGWPHGQPILAHFLLALR